VTPVVGLAVACALCGVLLYVAVRLRRADRAGRLPGWASSRPGDRGARIGTVVVSVLVVLGFVGAAVRQLRGQGVTGGQWAALIVWASVCAFGWYRNFGPRSRQ